MALSAIVDKLALPELGATLRRFHTASAQRQLLAGIDTTLVLHGDELINVVNGEARRLPADPELALPARLARAARSLLPTTLPAPHILLLLPAADFIGTRFQLGIQGEGLLRSALSLQAANLLPAYDRPLLLALNGQRGEGTALWYPDEHATALYDAFAAEGLQLVALQPRVTAAAAALVAASGVLLDADDQHLTLVHLDQGVLQAWHAVHRRDLEDAAFLEQWQAEQALLPAPAAATLDREYWRGLRSLPAPLEAYCFCPSGAIARGKQLVARQRRKRGALAAACLAGLLVLPFIGNLVQIALLERQVLALQDASADARRSQAAVYAMDDTWGPVAAYPRQNVGAMLLTLNTLIENSLSSFALNKGVIDISGFSQDPALLIEQLSEQEQFYNVGQSRGTSGGGNANRGDRFGIRMNVSGVDFSAYESQYEFQQP